MLCRLALLISQLMQQYCRHESWAPGVGVSAATAHRSSERVSEFWDLGLMLCSCPHTSTTLACNRRELGVFGCLTHGLNAHLRTLSSQPLFAIATGAQQHSKRACGEAMVDSATSSGDGGRCHHHLPPLLLLRPAHLRFYGIDAEPERSLPSRRQRQYTDANTSAHGCSLSTPRTTVIKSTSRPTSGSSSPEYSVGLQHDQQQAQGGSGNSVLKGSRGSNRRGKLPLAPPAMSARCQVHPGVMQEVGVYPGDPVLVLTLAEGWASNLARTAGAVPSRLPTTGGEASGSIVGISAVFSAEAEAEADRAVETCRQGVDDIALKAKGEREKTFLQHQPREQGLAWQRNEQPAPAGQKHHQSILLAEGVATVTCSLCTIWSNPNLAPAETAVDGRVNIPLSSTAIAAAAAVAAAQYGPRLFQPPPEAIETRAEESNDSASLLPTTATPALAQPKPSSTTTTTDTAADDLIARFLKTAVEWHLTGTGAGPRNGSCPTDAVIGIIPIHALAGGFGTGNVAGNRPGCGIDTPPVAGRISARVLIPSKHQGDRALLVAEAAAGAVGEAVATAGSPDGVRGGKTGASPPAGGECLTAALDQHQQQEQQYRRFLPPGYTSLVKRSLRHLLVSDGCEIAVPSCPDNIGGMAMMMEGSAAGSGVHGPRESNDNSDSGGGQQNLPPEDGTALVRIDFGGGGGDHQRGEGEGALSALINGSVSAIGPESLLLVENEASAGVLGSADACTGVAAAATALRDRELRGRGSEGMGRACGVDRQDVGGCGK